MTDQADELLAMRERRRRESRAGAGLVVLLCALYLVGRFVEVTR